MSGQGETTEGFRSGNARTRLEEIAYEQGVRDANVDEHLRSHDQSIRSHEQRLNAINGSIGRAADNTQKLTATVEALDEKIDALVEDKGIRDAVEDDRERTAARAISSRMLWAAVGAVVVPLLGVIVALVALILNAPH